MPKFAANLSMLYPEFDFLDRFEAAARDGFKAVECQFPYAWEAGDIAARLKGNDLQIILLNAATGEFDGGQRGMACLPGRDAEFQAGIGHALKYATALGCKRIHVMAGLLPAGRDRASLYDTYTSRLRWAAQEAGREGIDIMIEPINTRDVPGFFLNRQDHAHQVIKDVAERNLKVQMDLYHCQIVEGDVSTKLRQYLPGGNVGHIQIAGVPDRHEPDLGELNHPYLFSVLDELGYDGWVGCEYRPRAGMQSGGTSAGLGWLKPYLPGH